MKRTLLIAAYVSLVAVADASTVRTFDDVRFWTGEGANRAAVAIDWDGDASSDTSLVWGYRWDGDATGEQMLREVVAADPRLFAKANAGGGALGLAVYGWGYDLDDDGDFQLDDGTVFDRDGFAVTGPADGAEADDNDLYREGWEDGYWHYATGVSDAEGPTWTTSFAGPTQRLLIDGGWDSYAFATTLNADEFAQTLFAAAPPPLTGDFNADGRVDAADYTVWRDGLGDPFTTAHYHEWTAGYRSGQSLAVTIPEPLASRLSLSVFIVVASSTHRKS